MDGISGTAVSSTSYLLRAALPVQQVVSGVLQHVWCSPGSCSLSVPIFLHYFRTPVVCFALFSILFSFSFSSSCFLFIFSFFLLFLSWSGLFCCVLVSCTPALSLYLDDLRLFGLLCFTVVCDHIIVNMYLSRMNQHGLLVY